MNPILINEHFVRHEGLAMGINFAGSTLGNFIFPKLLEYLTKDFGFQGALLIFGAILLNSVAFTLFLRQPRWLKSNSESNLNFWNEPSPPYTISDTVKEPPGEKAQVQTPPAGKPETEEQSTTYRALSVFRLPSFYVITYSCIAFNLSYDCYNSLLVDFAVDRGIPATNAVTMTSLSSVAELVGRLSLPFVTDRGLMRRRTFMTLILAILGVFFMVMRYGSGYSSIFTMTSAIALLLGSGVVLFPVLLAEYVGLDRIAMATGMMTAISAVFSFVKPSIIGEKFCH